MEKGSGWKVLPGTLLNLVELKHPNGSCGCLHSWHHTAHTFAQGSKPCEITNKIKVNDLVYELRSFTQSIKKNA
jgi:hypothetical protein